jgi:hypothetical protein
VTCDCSAQKHQTAAAGRVLRVQGCPFSGNMPLGIPKKRVKSKKAFHFSSKKRSARVTCDCTAQKHQTAAAGRVLRVQGCPFSGNMPLGIPKKRVKSKKAFHFSSKKRSARVTCDCTAQKHQTAAAGRVLRVLILFNLYNDPSSCCTASSCVRVARCVSSFSTDICDSASA